MAEVDFERPGRIFVNYRREDTAYAAGWLFDRLSDRFGDEEIFKDIDSIELGDDFVDKITTAVASCDVFLALIGDRWLTITGASGEPRLHASDDFVRVEIEAALERGVRLIPILVDGAHMPGREQLPTSMASMTRRQALELSPSRFDFDVARLLDAVERTLADVRGRQPVFGPSVARPGRDVSEATDGADGVPPAATARVTAPVADVSPERQPVAPGEWLRRHLGWVAAGGLVISVLVALAVVAGARGGGPEAGTPARVSSTTMAVVPTASDTPASSPPPSTATPTTAAATTAPPTTTALISPQVFTVVQTCEVSRACGVQLKAGPNSSSATVGAAKDGERLTVVCQAEGELISLGAQTSDIWDHLADGRWISDLFLDTGTRDFLPTLPRCSG